MRKNGITITDALKKFGTKRMIAALMSLVFFVILITGCFTYMYSSEKDKIILRGELSAVHSKEQFNRYIAIAADTVKAARHKVQQLLDNGAGSDEITNYLTEDTNVLKSAVDERFTGLYGYINGEYYDGSGWIPDDDYEPTERPWYKKAIENDGEVTIIEPYTDADTGRLITSVVLTFEDRESVIAIDISYDMLHMLTSDDSSKSDVMTEFIMDSYGDILAHTDEKEIGHNYMKEQDTFGAAVVDKLFSTNDNCFDIKYDGTTYVVYSVEINDEWYSVSAIDSNESFRPLRIMLVIIIIITIITIILLIILYSNIIIRYLISEQLNNQLSATADIYFAVVDIDIINNKSSPIRSSGEVNPSVNSDFKDIQRGLDSIVEHIATEEYKDIMREFVNIKTLQDRLEGSRTTTVEFCSWKGVWCRARFVVSEYTSDGRISHVLWMVESIDEDKRKRDELKDISTKAIAASDAKSEFLSDMSHEIRTPINAVLGMNEMILRESSDENIIAYADNIQTAGNTLLGLINEILDFSKIEAGRMEITNAEYEMSSILNDLVNMIQPRVDEKELLLELEFDRTIPNRLKGDEMRIKQIITNILTNAVKYTNKGTVTFVLGYEKLEEESDSILVKVAIKDTGIGIKQEDIGNLFLKYERFDEERNHNIEGTGLGLPITQKLLNMMDSTLEVESEYGKGSEFSFKIKQEVVNWEPLGDYESSYKKNRARRKKYKAKFTAPDANILVIDDTKMNLFVFKSLLKQTRVHIDTAGSGDEGISAAVKNKYDMIFLDHMMPHKDGIQTLAELKTIDNCASKDAPVICLTANAISGARSKYIEAGFDDYLTKPIDSSKLEDMIIKYLPENKVGRIEEE